MMPPQTKEVVGLVQFTRDKQTYHLVRIDNEGYFAYRNEVRDLIRKGRVPDGARVRLKVTEGDYPKILELTVLGQQELGNGPAPEAEQPKPLPPQNGAPSTKQLTSQELKDLQIAKAVALKAAIDTLHDSALEGSLNDIAQERTDLAQIYLTWLVAK